MWQPPFYCDLLRLHSRCLILSQEAPPPTARIVIVRPPAVLPKIGPPDSNSDRTYQRDLTYTSYLYEGEYMPLCKVVLPDLCSPVNQLSGPVIQSHISLLTFPNGTSAARQVLSLLWGSLKPESVSSATRPLRSSAERQVANSTGISTLLARRTRIS